MKNVCLINLGMKGPHIQHLFRIYRIRSNKNEKKKVSLYKEKVSSYYDKVSSYNEDVSSYNEKVLVITRKFLVITRKFLVITRKLFSYMCYEKVSRHNEKVFV